MTPLAQVDEDLEIAEPDEEDDLPHADLDSVRQLEAQRREVHIRRDVNWRNLASPSKGGIKRVERNKTTVGTPTPPHEKKAGRAAA